MLASAMLSHMMFVMLALALPACKDLEEVDSPLDGGQITPDQSELSLETKAGSVGKEEEGTRKLRPREEIRNDGILFRQSRQSLHVRLASEDVNKKVDLAGKFRMQKSTQHAVPDRSTPSVKAEAHRLGTNPEGMENENSLYDYDVGLDFSESSEDQMTDEPFDNSQFPTVTSDLGTAQRSLRLPRSPAERGDPSDISDTERDHVSADYISVREEQQHATTTESVDIEEVDGDDNKNGARDMVSDLRLSRRLLKKRLRKEKSQVTNVADVLVSCETIDSDSSVSSLLGTTTLSNVSLGSQAESEEIDFDSEYEDEVDDDEDDDENEDENTKKTPRSQKKSRANCTSIPGYLQSSLLVVRRCPPSWKDQDVRHLCQTRKTLTIFDVVDGDVINADAIPAWGRDGRLYGNVHCAQCNGALPARTWDLFLDCNPRSKVKVIQGKTNLTLLKDFPRNATACQSRLEPGAGMALPVCGESGSRLSHRRNRRSVTDAGSVTSYPVSFSVLMNFGFDGKTHILFSSTHEAPRQSTVPKCAANHVYDPYSHSCRAITCPAGYELVHDSCVPTVRDEVASSDTVDLSALTQMSDTELVTLDVNLTADLVWSLSSPHFTEIMVKGISNRLQIRPERIQNLTTSWRNASEPGPVVQIHPLPVHLSPTPSPPSTQGPELLKDDDERPPRALMWRKEQFRLEGGPGNKKDLPQVFAPSHQIFEEDDDDGGGGDAGGNDDPADDRRAKLSRREISPEPPYQTKDDAMEKQSRANAKKDTNKYVEKSSRISNEARDKTAAKRSQEGQEHARVWRQVPGTILPDKSRGKRSSNQTSSQSSRERTTAPADSSTTPTATPGLSSVASLLTQKVSTMKRDKAYGPPTTKKPVPTNRPERGEDSSVSTPDSRAETQATVSSTNVHKSSSAPRSNAPNSLIPSTKGTSSLQRQDDEKTYTAIPSVTLTDLVVVSASDQQERTTPTSSEKASPTTAFSNTILYKKRSTVESQTASTTDSLPRQSADSSQTTRAKLTSNTRENIHEIDILETTTSISNPTQNDTASTGVTTGHAEASSTDGNLDGSYTSSPAPSEISQTPVAGTKGNKTPVDPDLHQCSKGANSTMVFLCRELIKTVKEDKLLLRISFILLPEQDRGEATVQDLLELMNRLVLDHTFRIDLGDGEPMVDVVSLTNKDQPIVMDTFCSRGVKDIHFDDEFALIPSLDVTTENLTVDVYVNRTRQTFHEGQYDLTVMVEGTTRDQDLTNVAFVFVCLLPRLRDKHCARMALLESEYTLLPNKSISFSERLYNMSQYEWTDEVTGSVVICVPAEYFRPPNASRAISVVQGCDKDFESFSKAEGYLSAVLGRLSIVAMAAVIMTYGLFPRMRNLPGMNTLNLTLALLVAEVLFFLGEDSSVPELCSAVAVALHFFFLASFFWMNVMTFDLFRTFANTCILTRMRSKRKYLWRYALYAWGCPLAVVLVCVVLDFSGLAPPDIIGYGGFHHLSNLSQHRDDSNDSETVTSRGDNSTRLQSRLGSSSSIGCWIQNPSATLLAFGAPMLLVFIVNTVLFVRTIIAIRATAKMVHLSTRRSSLRHLTGRNDVMLYVRMSTVMGFTWAFGLASALVSATGRSEPSRALCMAVHILGILFNIFNCSQGLFIFVAFTLKRRVFLLYKGLLLRVKAWVKLKTARRSRSRPSSCSSSSSANTTISVLSDNTRNSPIVHHAVGASVSACLEANVGGNPLLTSGLVLGRSAPPLLLSWSSFREGKASPDYSLFNKAFVDDDDLHEKITVCDENRMTDKLPVEKRVDAPDTGHVTASKQSAPESPTAGENQDMDNSSSETEMRAGKGRARKNPTADKLDSAYKPVESLDDSSTRGGNFCTGKLSSHVSQQQEAVDQSAIDVSNINGMNGMADVGRPK